MDSRGYGRRDRAVVGHHATRHRRADPHRPARCRHRHVRAARRHRPRGHRAADARRSGSSSSAVGMRVGGRSVQRSVYRPDPWALPEWLVAASGLVAAALMVVQAARAPRHAGPARSSRWPRPPCRCSPCSGLLVAALPAFVAPDPPVSRRRPARARPDCTGRLDPHLPVVFDHVTIRYADSARPALRSASFVLEEGELVVVTGRTGSGKSTLLGAVNGTVPHFTGGHLSGRVSVFGHDTRTHRPRDLAGVVGVVRQDPLAGLRHRHRRGGARLHPRTAGPRSRRHAPPGRGGARPARHRRPARRAAARPLRRPAAARRDRLGAHRQPAAARPRRTHLRARPDRCRGGPRDARRGWSTTSA